MTRKNPVSCYHCDNGDTGDFDTTNKIRISLTVSVKTRQQRYY